MKTPTCSESGGGEVYYPLAAVRALLGISSATLWRQCQKGLKKTYIGSVVRIRKSDLDEFIEAQTKQNQPKDRL